MGSFTAHILVGSPHPNHDGIIPTHSLFLSENSRPAWILVSENVSEESREDDDRITWTPTEDALEDALLMIAIYVVKNREVLDQAKAFNRKVGEDLAGPSALTKVQRSRLYQTCRTLAGFPKITVSVLRGSLIESQLSVLESYGMDVEVCPVGYSRLYSSWREKTQVEGSLGRARPSMKPPSNIDRPFFAYGIFRPGQLGFFQLRELVDSAIEPAQVAGSLLLRDGLPIIDPTGRGVVPGVLLTFLPGRAAEAYGRISDMEPDKHYRWDEKPVSGTVANVLLGRSPKKGSVECDYGEWNGWDDPLFREALDVVGEALGATDRFDRQYKALFRLQMAYLLLWSSIERYVSLRYCLSNKVMEKVHRLAGEQAFADGLLAHVRGQRKVYRADQPSEKVVLKSEAPKEALEYYYQVRSNITHRGKAAVHEDYETLEKSLKELLPIFCEVLQAARRDAVADSPREDQLFGDGGPSY